MTEDELIISAESGKISLDKFNLEELREDLNETEKFLDQMNIEDIDNEEYSNSKTINYDELREDVTIESSSKINFNKASENNPGYVCISKILKK